MKSILIYRGLVTSFQKHRSRSFFIWNKMEIIMKEIITTVKGMIDEFITLMMSFVAVGAMSEVLFGSGIFGVNVIANLMVILSKFGENGFVGLVALLLLVGLFRK